MEIERVDKRGCCGIREIRYGDCFDWNGHIFIRVKKKSRSCRSQSRKRLHCLFSRNGNGQTGKRQICRTAMKQE